MKKYTAIFLILLLLSFMTACGHPTPTSSSTAPPIQTSENQYSASLASSHPLTVEPTQEGKVLIAYFTWAENTVVANPTSVDVDAVASASVLSPGNTAQMAAWIQQEMGGDLFSIVVDEPYPSDYDACLDRAADEKADNSRPTLTSHVENIEAYDVIFLGFPNWWYTAPMAVFSFIEEYDLSGKTVIPFCAHGTGGLASSVQDITAALPDSTVLTPIGVNREDIAGAQETINEWLYELRILEE